MNPVLTALDAYLNEQGLTTPPVPEPFRASLVQRGPEHFDTSTDVLDPGDTDAHLLRLHETTGDYLVVAQAGGGRPSTALHYYLVWRPLALLMKMPWGSPYVDERDREAIVRCFALADELCTLRSRLGPDELFVVFASEIYPCMLIRPGDRPDRTVFGAEQTLQTAIEWLKSR